MIRRVVAVCRAVGVVVVGAVVVVGCVTPSSSSSLSAPSSSSGAMIAPMPAGRADLRQRAPYRPGDRTVHAEAVRSTLLAELSLQAGDVPAAVEQWRSASHADDTSPYLRVRLGESLLLVGDVEGAVVAADLAVALGNDGKDDELEREHVLAGWRLRSLALAANGDTRGAMSALRAALALSPGEPRASALLAEHLVAAGDLDGAEAVVAAWMNDAPDVRGTVQLAKVFADRAQVARAFKLLDAALSRLPDDENALGTRRDLLLALGRYDEAAQAARALLAAIGDAASSRGSMITTLALSAPDEARTLAHALLAADDTERSHLIVASSFEAAGLLDDAVAAVTTPGASTSFVLRLERARLELSRGNVAAARAVCSVVASGVDERFEDHRLLLCAQALADGGDVDAGIATLLKQDGSAITRPRVITKLTALAPRTSPERRAELVDVAQAALAAAEANHDDARDDVVIAAAGLLVAADDRRVIDAVAVLDTVIARRPAKAAARIAKLRLQTADSRSDAEVLAAVADFEQQQKRRKDDDVDVDSLNFMAFTLAERGLRSADARAFAWRALLRDPTNGYITDTLGWAQLKDGAVDDAVATLRRADRLAPHEAEVWFHIAVAEARRGDEVHAVEAIANARRFVTAGDPLRARIDVVAAALSAHSALPSSP